MTIAKIALKNIKGNLNKYAMYCISNIIVVTIFFIFANFIISSNLGSASSNSGKMGQTASSLMYACEFIIVIFTFVFTMYSLSNFLKSREKEFGLLSMFGVTKSQIRIYIMFENILISIVSIIIGLLLGVLFSKLFFMAVTVILDIDLQIKFNISFKALKLTIICFFLLFSFMSFITSFKIKNNNIAQLLKGERIPKISPRFSKLKVILSISLILLGYIVGINSKAAIMLTMLPILLVVTIGTYFLFSQFSVYFTSKLHSNKGIYYKGINLIVISQIIYKLKDNAKILFITTMLSGITIASAISVYSLQETSLNSMKENEPQDISVIEQGINSHKVIANGKIEEVLKNNNFDIEHKEEIKLLKGENAENQKKTAYSMINKSDFNIMSESSYNSLAKYYNRSLVSLKSGEIDVLTYDLTGNLMNMETKLPFENEKNLNININGVKQSFSIKENMKGGIINGDSKHTNTIVVSDNEFDKLWEGALNSDKYLYYGYNIEHYLKATNAVNEIKQSINKGQEDNFDERITSAASLMQFLSVFLFIGTFIAIIFFIATGSILYFKMFNEIQKDKHEFIGLKKLGFTVEEIKRVVSIQSFIMFFLPLTIALLHAAFAVKAVGLLYAQYFALIAIIYIVLQAIYYLFARWMYVKQINGWSMK